MAIKVLPGGVPAGFEVLGVQDPDQQLDQPSAATVFACLGLGFCEGFRRMACRRLRVRVSLAPLKRSPVSGWAFLLPIRGDSFASCSVLVQTEEAVQALGAYLAKADGLGT